MPYKGYKQTESHRTKISLAKKDKKVSTETRAKISLALKGHPVSERMQAEYKRRRGTHHTLEARLKISKARKGKPLSEKQRASYEKRRGTQHSSETKMKIRLAKLGKPISEKQKAAYELRKLDTHLKKIVKNFIKRHTKRTKIETKLKRLVESLGYNFEEQTPLTPQAYITIADGFVEPNFVFYADGCYYHSCPIHYPNKYPIIVEHDRFITQELEGLGYVVLRFWEHEINSEPKKVKARIAKVLGSRTLLTPMRLVC